VPSAPSVPRHRSDAWLRGFVIDSPGYTPHVAAAGGTVIAASEGGIYRMRPGATRFEMREIPEGHGDVVAVAVEPHLPGQRARFAFATFAPSRIHVHDGEGLASFELPRDYGELVELTWAPRMTGRDPTACLFLRFDDDRFLMLRTDDGRHAWVFEKIEWPAPNTSELAADGAGGMVIAAFDEEAWDLDVWILMDQASLTWGIRSLEAPSFFSGAQMAVAGMAVAVSFELGGVWLSRDVREHPFVELEELRGLDTRHGGTGAGREPRKRAPPASRDLFSPKPSRRREGCGHRARKIALP
jgi:hypothetical protein